MKKFKVRELFTVPVLIIVWILLIHSGFEFFLAKNINNLKRFEKNDASIFVKEAENDLNYHIKNLVYFSSRIDAYIQNRYYNPDSSEIKLLIWDLIKNNSDAINLVALKFGSFQYIFNIEMEPVNPAGITLPDLSSGTDKNHTIKTYSFLVQKNNIFFHSPINEKISGHKSSLDIQLNFNLFLETLINNAVTDGYSYALTTDSNEFLFGNSDLVLSSEAQMYQFNNAIIDLKLYYYRENPLLSGFFMSYIPWIIRLLSVFVLSLVLFNFRNRNGSERSLQLKKLLLAVDQSPASIVLTDIKGNIEYVNPQFSETTGYSKEEVMGNNPRILKSSLHDKNFYEELWSTISSGKQWKGIFFNKKKDGTVYYESAIISPIINEKGVITNYLAIKDNITEKFQAERALKISEARFRAIVDNSMTGIAIIDEEGRHIYTNPSTKKIHGYKQEEIIGSLFADIIFKDDKDQAERILKDIASGLKHFAIEELRLIHKVTKKVVWVNLNISKYPKVEEFEQERILLLFQDITKHKEAEIQLKQSIITRDKMFSIISHDLRGPIGNLIPLFDMFSNMETSEELRNELIKEMRRTTATTYDLLENLLSWSKFQTKSISLVPVNFNVNETIEEIVELYNNEANQKNISVTIESANKNFVFADKNSVNLIIRNMLYNAIKFTPKFGKISLKAQSKEGVIFVSITDSGIGMTEDVAKNIFNKDTFYTSYGTNNEIGTGLGLQLCREFVIKNGGKINVISRVGKGTTFEFTLPKGKQTATKTSLVIPKIKTDSSSLRNKRILLVEDDKFNLVYTKSLFEKWRVSYDVAENGEEAITKLSENTYDVVVMDLEMPVMDGITTCIHIRTQLKLEVPVIAISANIGSDIVEKTQRAGFTDYVSKPIDSGFLFVKIANALKIKVEGDEVISGLSSSQYSQDSAYSSIEQLKIAFGDDTSMAKEMIFKFLEVTPSYYKDMMYFYEISDFQNLRQIAHKLKSSIGFFTTEDLAHEVKLINDYAGTADTYNLEPVMTHFKEWFPKLCDELKLLKL